VEWPVEIQLIETVGGGGPGGFFPRTGRAGGRLKDVGRLKERGDSRRILGVFQISFKFNFQI
jgi:hypothetical protein